MTTASPEIATGPGWELRLGDCLDPVHGLASLADKSVDHFITDPPFASEIYERPRMYHPTTASGTSPGMDLMRAGGIGSIDEVIAPITVQAHRLARRWVLAFIDAESVGDVRRAMLSAGLRYVRTGAWAKSDPMPQFTGDRPAHGFEACCIAHADKPRKMRWNGGGQAAIWLYGVCKKDRPDHPCPKPLPLMERLVGDFTDPGELICDPFAGSGTTGVACIRLGRRFIGWERDPKYFAVAVKRLSAAREQFRLFEGVG